MLLKRTKKPQYATHKKRRPTPPKKRGLIRGFVSTISKLLIFLAILTGTSLTFMLLYNYLLTSPYMILEEVQIQGVAPPIQGELIQMAGLDRRQSLLSLNLSELKHKMEQHPWVETVNVERRFPHTLIVTAQKEVPIAVVLRNQFFYLNRKGATFKPVLPFENMDLPIVTGISETDRKCEEKQKRVAQVLALLEHEKGPYSVKNLSEAHLKETGEITLYFSHIQAGVTFLWDQLAQNMEGLKRLTKHLEKTGKMDMVNHINLNHADGAVVTFKDGKVSHSTST